jgi:hypothetical protein
MLPNTFLKKFTSLLRFIELKKHLLKPFGINVLYLMSKYVIFSLVVFKSNIKKTIIHSDMKINTSKIRKGFFMKQFLINEVMILNLTRVSKKFDLLNFFHLVVSFKVNKIIFWLIKNIILLVKTFLYRKNPIIRMDQQSMKKLRKSSTGKTTVKKV